MNTNARNATDLHLLRCLVALVHEGNVSRAAARLGLSQPAASHALARLRRVFDDPLLVRSGGGMMPTPRGRELADEARAIVERVAHLVAPVKPFDAVSFGGLFVVSAPEYVEHLLCPVLARSLSEEAPAAQLRIRPPDPRQADRHLESGEIDLRLGWVRDPAPSTRSKVLFTDQFVCLVRQGHPAVRTPFTVERYAGLSHIRAQSAVPSTASRLIDEAVGRIGARLNVPIVVPSHLTIGRVIETTDLVATVPQCIAQTLVAHLRLRVLPSPVKIPPLRVAMYWHERMHTDPRHRWLRGLVSRASETVVTVTG